jgi:hypothetical protein
MAMEEFDEGETKPVLRLKNSKGLVLNRTNAATIASFLGDDTDTWTGRQIVLFPAKVNFQVRLTDAIRVREPRPQASAAPAPAPKSASAAPAPAPAPAPAVPAVAGYDDDVPF